MAADSSKPWHLVLQISYRPPVVASPALQHLPSYLLGPACLKPLALKAWQFPGEKDPILWLFMAVFLQPQQSALSQLLLLLSLVFAASALCCF
jgi:hypothetical protein